MKILIVEDDPVYAKYLKHNVELNPDFEAVVFKNGGELLRNLRSDDQVITLDYSLPDMSCEVLIKRIREINQTAKIVTISAQEEITTAVKLLRAGVYDYIEKNEEARDRLLNTLKHIRENQSLINITHKSMPTRSRTFVTYDSNAGVVNCDCDTCDQLNFS